MKKGHFDGKKSPEPEQVSMAEGGPLSPRANRNFFLEGIAKIVQAIKPKRFVSYRKKMTNKDGSTIETEFIYRDDH